MSTQPDSGHCCQVCGTAYVVPSLARDCEEQHAHPLRAQDVPALIAKDLG